MKHAGLIVRPGHGMHGWVASVEGGAVLLSDGDYLPGRRFIAAGREFFIWTEDETASDAVLSALIDAEPSAVRQVEVSRLVPRREA